MAHVDMSPCDCNLKLVWPSIKAAVHFINKAVAEEENKNYEEALELYKEGVSWFRYAIDNDAEVDWVKEGLRDRSKKYRDRIALLEAYLEKRKRNDKIFQRLFD